MPIQVQCDCGKSARVKDDLAGRKVRCPGCQGVIAVPMPEKDIEDEALDILLADPAPEDASHRAKRRPNAESRADDTDRFSETRPEPRPSRPRPAATPKSRPAAPKEKRGRAHSSVALNREIVTGVLMMLGAAVWFFIGLSAGFIYFYPPVLFILGVGAVIRGFTGGD